MTIRSLLERARLLLVIALVVTLGACAGIPNEPSGGDRAAVEAPVSPPLASGPSPVAPGRSGTRGGYYLDDGPEDNPPANLADIPDAEPRAEPLRPASNRPYTALGMSFEPLRSVQPFSQRGLASWYGRRFHGAKTSSGEPYNMYSMTAAHPTLPIPSYARVTNLANGKTVVVRVNDRGPFHAGRVIDLSYTAAWKLGYVSRGSTEVMVEAIVPDELDMLIASKTGASSMPPAIVVRATPQAKRSLGADAAPQMATQTGDAPTQTPSAMPISGTDVLPPTEQHSVAVASASATNRIFLQLGAFAHNANAESFREHVRNELKWLKEEIVTMLVGEKYRLHVGPFATAEAARSAGERIARALRVQPFVVAR